ncbi:alpha/beta hydrolase-fold protein [Streptomyces buecherae]|uniref:alpha/beta hydrolase-fold protein n=1 Tax=Streptomyces buecherae TaxID=2763006 RepID=UPI003669C516
MERRYGAGRRRAAAGESQAGFGALGFAARVPGLFRAVAAFGSPVHPNQHPEMWLSGAAFLGVEDPYTIFGDPWHQWRVWLDWDPYHRADGLRDTPLYLSSGDGRRTSPPARTPAPTVTARRGTRCPCCSGGCAAEARGTGCRARGGHGSATSVSHTRISVVRRARKGLQDKGSMPKTRWAGQARTVAPRGRGSARRAEAKHRGVGTEGHIGAGRSRARAADARTSSTEDE